MTKSHKYHCLSSPEGGGTLLALPDDCVKIISLTCNGNPLSFADKLWFSPLAASKPFLNVVIPPYPYYSVVNLEYNNDWNTE